MSEYLSQEWLELGRKAINASTKFRKIAKGMSLVISHRIVKGLNKKELAFWSTFKDGECVEVKLGEHPAPNFILTGFYDTWIKIHKGDLDIVQAILEKAILVEGKPVKGIKILKLAPLMNKLIASIETTF